MRKGCCLLIVNFFLPGIMKKIVNFTKPFKLRDKLIRHDSDQELHHAESSDTDRTFTNTAAVCPGALMEEHEVTRQTYVCGQLKIKTITCYVFRLMHL